MRILITGSSGFLGTAATRALSDYQVILHTRAICDLSRPNCVQALLNAEAPEVIINTAAVADFTGCGIEKLRPVNTDAPSIMAEWCAQRDALLIHASATIVHGIRATRASSEIPINPDSAYGLSKYLAERNIVASGCTHVIVRFGGIYGYPGPSHLGL